MTAITLPHNFTPRPYQEDFFSAMNKGCKRAVLVWSRRSGKDTCAWNYLIYTAVETKGIYYYIFPTFAQGRKILWDGMTNNGYKFIDFIPKALIRNINNQEMKIRLSNGSLIQVVGSDNYDSIRGTNPSGCIFSEFAEQNPNVWMVVSPILDSNNGWAIFVFTPKGTNHAKVTFDQAKSNPNWYCSYLTCEDTKSITKEKLAEIRAEGLMSEDMIQQEHFCSFTLGIMGSYFASYVAEAKEDGRICNVKWEKNARVSTAWDLGYGDMTSIIWFQIVSNEVHIIDHYENHGKELAHYAKILADKPYLYDRHFVPHDADKHELSTGLSVREVGSSMGLQFTVLPTLRVSHEDTIECCRGLFPRIWIDQSKCKFLLICLENYRSEYDKDKELYKPRAVHDKFSHTADAFRYLCLSVRRFVDQAKGGPGDDDVDRMMDKYQPRFT